jgi:hypothetical protein
MAPADTDWMLALGPALGEPGDEILRHRARDGDNSIEAGDRLQPAGMKAGVARMKAVGAPYRQNIVHELKQPDAMSPVGIERLRLRGRHMGVEVESEIDVAGLRLDHLIARPIVRAFRSSQVMRRAYR